MEHTDVWVDLSLIDQGKPKHQRGKHKVYSKMHPCMVKSEVRSSGHAGRQADARYEKGLGKSKTIEGTLFGGQARAS